MKNSDQPAFPISETNSVHQQMDFGLTKREYFAALAMQGILSGPYMNRHTNNIELPDLKTVAEQSIDYADELLKQLEIQQP